MISSYRRHPKGSVERVGRVICVNDQNDKICGVSLGGPVRGPDHQVPGHAVASVRRANLKRVKNGYIFVNRHESRPRCLIRVATKQVAFRI